MRYFFHNFHVVIYNILLNNHFIKIQKREKRKTREKAKQLLQFPNGYCQIKMIGKILLIFYFFFHFFFGPGTCHDHVSITNPRAFIIALHVKDRFQLYM